MKAEMIIGLSIFAVFTLTLIQSLIRLHCSRIRLKREKAFSEYKARREEVERKARRQL